MAYPKEQGKKKGSVLPDMSGPMAVEADKGDKCVPANDMGDVAPTMTMGRNIPDPLNLVDIID